MAVGVIGPAETDMYRPVTDQVCKCRWCGWEGNVFVLPRSAHERGLAHRSAARARGIELPRPVRIKYKNGSTLEFRAAEQARKESLKVEVLDEIRETRKLPKPKLTWRANMSAREWTAPGQLRVRQVGMNADNTFLAYCGLKYLGGETSLERAQALAEHPELE